MMRKNLPVSRLMPIKVSQAARMMIGTWGWIKPNVSISIVAVASSLAGLSHGKNFKNPNQKKTIPELILR
ncbi:MAG: hypothetical protein PVF74_08540 [Anaerolineales bacterium]